MAVVCLGDGAVGSLFLQDSRGCASFVEALERSMLIALTCLPVKKDSRNVPLMKQCYQTRGKQAVSALYHTATRRPGL